MKNVLLTTTALVAFAGAAAAEVTLTWGGSAQVDYAVTDSYIGAETTTVVDVVATWNAVTLVYDVVTITTVDGVAGAPVNSTSATDTTGSTTTTTAAATAAGTFTTSADLGVSATASTTLNNGAVASLTAGSVLSYDGSAWSLGTDSFVAKLETSYGSLSFGSIDNVNAGTFAVVAGMDVDPNATDDDTGTIDFGTAAHIIRADSTLSGYTIAASSNADGSDAAANVSGSASGFDFALFYETTAMGVNVSGAFGGATVAVAYATDGVETSSGIGIGYAVTDAISVAASHATNSAVANQTAIGVAYAAGGIAASFDYDVDASSWDAAASYTTEVSAGTTVTVGATYNSAGDTTGTVDLVHVAGDMTVYAGADMAQNMYGGVVYDLGGGAAAYAYYSDSAVAGDTDLGPLNWDSGTVLGVSLTF